MLLTTQIQQPSWITDSNHPVFVRDVRHRSLEAGLVEFAHPVGRTQDQPGAGGDNKPAMREIFKRSGEDFPPVWGRLLQPDECLSRQRVIVLEKLQEEGELFLIITRYRLVPCL